MSLRELFEKEGEQIQGALRSALDSNNINATGKLRKSIQYEATDTRLTVSALAYIFTVEDGRGPTSRSKRGRIAGLIYNWLEAKPVPKWEGVTRWQQAYIIANKIDREGTKRFRNKGNSGIISSVINEKLLDSIAAKALRETEREFLEGIAIAGKNAISNI